jgi:hypothetical protein
LFCTIGDLVDISSDQEWAGLANRRRSIRHEDDALEQGCQMVYVHSKNPKIPNFHFSK